MGFFYCIISLTDKFDPNTLSLSFTFHLILLLIIWYPLFFCFDFELLTLTHLDFIYFLELIVLFGYLSFHLTFEIHFSGHFYCRNILTFYYQSVHIS